jgi:hypothetical protein
MFGEALLKAAPLEGVIGSTPLPGGAGIGKTNLDCYAFRSSLGYVRFSSDSSVARWRCDAAVEGAQNAGVRHPVDIVHVQPVPLGRSCCIVHGRLRHAL